MTLWSALCLTAAIILAAPLFGEFREQPAQPDEGFLELPPLLRTRKGKPITTREGWRRRRRVLERRWREFLGPFPRRVALRVKVVSTEILRDHTRLLLRYHNEAGVDNEAYLLLPPGNGRPRPGMVVLHATSNSTIRDPVGLDGRPSNHIALRLVRRGYVCIVPRCFLWGYGGTKTIQEATDALLVHQPWKTGMAKMLWDARRALDVLEKRPEVDASRLGVIGHSLGGKEALYLGAFDSRVKATVSCEGGIGQAFSNWDAQWYLGPAIKAPGFEMDHQELIALTAPRPFLLVGGNSADGAQSWPYVESALAVYKLLGAEERLGLQIHSDGHNFPPPGLEEEAMFAWLGHWLGHPKD